MIYGLEMPGALPGEPTKTFLLSESTVWTPAVVGLIMIARHTEVIRRSLGGEGMRISI